MRSYTLFAREFGVSTQRKAHEMSLSHFMRFVIELRFMAPFAFVWPPLAQHRHTN